MKFPLWPRKKQKRFDLEAALAKAKNLKPGEPLLLEGHPSPQEINTLYQRWAEQKEAEAASVIVEPEPAVAPIIHPARTLHFSGVSESMATTSSNLGIRIETLQPGEWEFSPEAKQKLDEHYERIAKSIKPQQAAPAAPAKPKPAPKQTRAHRAMSQKRAVRRSK